MSSKTIESGKSPKIEVGNCNGDLVIRSWAKLAIGASGEYQVEKGEHSFSFISDGDLQMEVPENSNVYIGKVFGDVVVKNLIGGLTLSEIYGDVVLVNNSQVKIQKIRSDLSVKSLQGPVNIEVVDGDIVLRNVDDNVAINQVKGDLTASFINGDLSIQQVSGDVNLRTVGGNISINAVNRDVNLRNLGGPNNIESVQGDIRIIGSLTAAKHRFNAKGDIVLRWPVNAPINLFAEAPEVQNKLPLVEVKELDNGLSGRIGEGETTVHLIAQGKILLKEEQIIDKKWQSGEKWDEGMDFMFDFAGIGERVSAEVNHHITRMANHLETQFGPEFAQNISEKVSKQAEKAARQAEKAAEKARKYAEREVYRAQRRNPYQGTSAYRNKAAEPVKTQPKTTSEEQLKILKMVEKGTISPDEANTLLDALEG